MVWFIDKPEILEDELARLTALNLVFSVDEEAKKNGRLIVNVVFPIDGVSLNLICSYPYEYPFFPPEITASNFPLGRHLEPYGKSLCIFADKHNMWDISKDTLAGLIQDQVAKIYRIHMDPSGISEFEDKLEGYQPSGQLVAEEFSVVVVPATDEELPLHGAGYLQVNSLQNLNFLSDSMVHPFTGCIRILTNSEGKSVFEDNTGFHKRFGTRVPFRWLRLKNALKATDGKGIYSQVIEEFPEFEKPTYSQLGKTNVDIIGVCFEEETSRRKIENNWLFLIRRAWRRNKKQYTQLSIVRCDHLNADQLYARTPRLLGLAEKTVALIGVGALGSQVAFQLARAGVKNFIFIDKDHLQIGNLSRWVGALPLIGMPKVFAITQILNRDFLGLTIEQLKLEIGGIHKIRTTDGAELTIGEYLQTRVLARADLVIDCSAMLNINQYLSQLCKSENTDFIWCSATNGAWGGIVGRSPADHKHDVWMRYNSLYAKLSIATEPTDFVQPKGCFHPTFTGAGFDLDSISNMTSRMAVSMLQGDTYGKLGNDVYVVDQWDNDQPISPQWKGFNVSDG